MGVCENFSASYGWPPSGRRIGVSTLCLTGSAGVTFCGRRGGGCGRTRGLPGSTGRPWRRLRSSGWIACWARSRLSSPEGRIARCRFGGSTIPKPQGGVRPLGIPTVKDRVVQQAARIVLEPIFEADFLPVSFGFRPRRSATDAKEVLRGRSSRGHQFVFEADIRDYFGQIDHEQASVVGRCAGFGPAGDQADRQVAPAGVMDEGVFRRSMAGTPQGGVISPLLSNIYLHALDGRSLTGLTAHSSAMRTTVCPEC